MNKVVARVLGGIGNQLFIYAAARRLALVNKAKLIIDSESGFDHDKVYQRRYQLDHFCIPCHKATAAERLEPFPRLRRAVMRKLNQQIPFELRRYIVQEGVDFDPRLLTFIPQGTVYLEGYWQSENYFRDVSATIRQDLLIHPPSDGTSVELAARIRRCNAVAIHARFFDEPKTTGINNAPNDYYNRALQMMGQLAPDAHYFLFSDQPEAARARISFPNDQVTVVAHNKGDENAYADLWLMTQCQHFIIANSTFSWWGAWLSANPNKIVIAPGYEKRDGVMWWGFKGLLPDEWIKL
jgi:hypothetical protein